MNEYVDYNKLTQMTNDEIFNLYSEKYKDFGLYNMSLEWRKNKEYILKFKGSYGDVIINWN